MKSELQDRLNDCEAELVDIDERLENLDPFDKTRKYLTYYALIRACGTAEYVYRAIVADYFTSLGDTKIDKFLNKAVREGSMSASYNNMCNLLQRFDDNWKEQFSQEVKNHPDGNRIISSAKSLVANRHAFAHGRSISASFSDIKLYYMDMMILIEVFDNAVR